jgi:RimJ/RimL family protein N-acetyltransferase
VSDLLTRRVAALYSVDADGRLLRTNEWDGRPAPRFHLMRTEQGPITRYGAGVPDAVVRDLEALANQERWTPLSGRLPDFHQQFVARLMRQAPVEKVWSGPAYVFTEDPVPVRQPTPIDAANAHLLARTFPDWLTDITYRQPFVAAVDGGEAASICASVRISPHVHCAGVETHPDHRRRGHAIDAVAGWARAVRALGATPFYSTSWDNLASQAVASRLGLRLVGADFHVT